MEAADFGRLFFMLETITFLCVYRVAPGPLVLRVTRFCLFLRNAASSGLSRYAFLPVFA